MKPSDILREEHRVIELVLNCLERIEHDALAQGRIDHESAEKALDFLRNFADRCHHGKEESHFFPAMEAKGFPREGGPTGVMLDEHQRGRDYIRGMSGALTADGAGQADALAQFVRNAHGYIALLREHIHKEDHCLFTMADKVFDDGDQKQLLDAFEHVEHAELGPGTHARYLALAEELCDHLGVAQEAITAAGCGCASHS